MVIGDKALRRLRNVTLFAFVAALLAGIFVPIYTDEIGWRLQERAAIDGVDKLFSEYCGPNTLAHPPFWMMAARYYSALFNLLFAEPIFVRLSGILYALVWTGMALELVRRIANGSARRTSLSAIAIGLMSLGTMPLLMVISRPEQPILLAFTGGLLIATNTARDGGGDTRTRTAWTRSLAILCLALVAMSYHVKGVATVPLFLVCLALSSRGRNAIVPRVVVGAVLIGAAAWAGHYWVERFACPADALVRADFMRNTGAQMVSISDRSQIWPVVAKALSNVSLFLFPGLPAPRAEPMSFWLPAGRIGPSGSFTWFLALVALWSVAYLATAYCLACSAKRSWQERRLDHRAILAAALLATVLGWSATGFVSVYEASFTLPMLVFMVVFALSTLEAKPSLDRGVRLAAAGVAVAGLASIAFVALLYGPALADASRERGYLKAQPISISVFGYAQARRDILAAAAKCGIVDPAARRALVIDDITYFPFMASRLPEHRIGVINPILARDPIEYLQSIKSDGIVASCRALPLSLQARAKREGQFCCLAPPDW